MRPQPLPSLHFTFNPLTDGKGLNVKQAQGLLASSPQSADLLHLCSQSQTAELFCNSTRVTDQAAMLGHPETTKMNEFYLGTFIRLAVPYLTLLGRCPGLRSKCIKGTCKGTK